MNEKYIPLYRKYRPQTLEQIVGQGHIKTALANAINLNKIAHAYLFTGPRGTGKTSSARILAKSLNCTNGPTISPCGVCTSCVDIANSTPIDVIEIDAASNRKVEDAQNILEKIQYVPINGKYKIYIIDEVHMLTNHAFNALLKTLEEPPENVIFILATTEPQKVLDTIKSRCQRFDFKRITTEDIVNHLKNISKIEKINIEDDALLTIAKNSAGGMRDSIALLDQLSVLDCTKAITTEDINMLLGRISFEILNKLSENIINSKPEFAIEILEEVYNSGNEPTQIMLNLLTYFKNLLVVKNCRKEIVFDLTQLAENQIDILKKQSEKLDTHQIIFLIEKVSSYIKELKTTTNQHLWLEVAMIDLANMAENTSLIALQSRISKLESGMPQSAATAVYKTPPTPVLKPLMKPATPIQKDVIKTDNKIVELNNEDEFTPMPTGKAVETSNKNVGELWQSLLANISSPSAQALLRLANPIEISPEQVIIAFKNEVFVKQANDVTKKQVIIDAANALFNQKNTKVIIRLPIPSDFVHPKSIEAQKPQPEIPKIMEKQTKVVSEKNEIIELSTISEDNEEEINVEKEPFISSDQVKMVMDLFDGKMID